MGEDEGICNELSQLWDGRMVNPPFILYWQRTIIVHQGRIKPNDERFDLSIKDKSVKPPILKMP
jgi:hypothetical protein